MRTNLAAPILALALAGAAAAPPAYAAATITSTFDTGTEGWTFGSYLGFSGLPITYEAATQNIAMINNGYGSFGFIAPTAYLGDKSEYVNGTFAFDVSVGRVDTAYFNRPAIVLTGNGKTIFAKGVGVPGTSLKRLEVGLSAANFYTGSPTGTQTAVSTADFAAIMANLKQVQVWADWNGGVETDRLDNVSMSAGGVPEPATWALMILGFGAAGSALRRRRVAIA